MKNKKSTEYRSILNIGTLEEGHTVEGVILYNTDSQDLGGFIERIAPSAFKKTLNDRADVMLLWQHDNTKVLGRIKNNSLVLENREDGLHFKAELPDTAEANDIWKLVHDGYVDEVSFGFIAIHETNEHRDHMRYRTITEARLLEISLVSCAAYPSNTVDARALEDEAEETKTEATEVDKAENIDVTEVDEKPVETVVEESKESSVEVDATDTLTEEEQIKLNEAYQRLLELEKKLDKRSIFINGKCFIK